MKPSELTYIDLFAGAGGLSEGFIHQGFKPVAHVEMDENACLTLKTRQAYHHLKSNRKNDIYYEYLKNLKSDYNKNKTLRDELYSHMPEQLSKSVINQIIDKNSIPVIFEQIDQLLNKQKVDVIIGGPPCQAYSLVGRARDPERMAGDPRNHLYKHYTEFLKKYKPSMFIFENVQGLKTAAEGKYLKNMLQSFDNAGYNTDYKILKSNDYGVLQTRKRIILIGWQKNKKIGYPEILKLDNPWNTKHLFEDLPPLNAGEGENVLNYFSRTNDYLEKFHLRNGEKFVTQHITRNHTQRDLEIYGIAIDLWLNERRRLKYTDLPKHLQTHKNIKSFLDRFKVVDPFTFSHTMVAHIAKDGHHYIYPDKQQIRSLSIREAARIQSFPDDYYFEGGQTAAFKQIGNAVPPLMADAIAKGIKEFFD